MLEQIFKAMLITSCAGAALTALIAAVKPFTKRCFSAGWNYYIWLTVLLVMMLPVRFALPAAVNITAEPQTRTALTQTQSAAGTGEAAPPAETASSERNAEDAPLSGVSQFAAKANGVMDTLAIIWLAAAALIFAGRLALYAAFVRGMKRRSRVISCPEISRYTKRRVTVRAGEALSSPLTVGLFRKTLLLPDVSLTDAQLANVLAHETTHINRNDILYKWLVTLVKCVHWFNPAVYFAARQINAECEISCDAVVTANMSKAEKLEYVDTILALISDKNRKAVPFTTGMAGSKKMLERRFVMMTRNKRVSKRTRALSAVLAAAALAATVFTSGVLANEILGGEESNVIRYEIYNGDTLIETAHQPMIYNHEYYLPLRETLNGFSFTDISYRDGEATVTVPENEGIAPLPSGIQGEPEYYPSRFILDVNQEYPGVLFDDFSSGYGMRSKPILVDGTMYAPSELFEVLVHHYASFANFRLNVIKPTDPKSYYDSGEEVVIGTAREQDLYTSQNPNKVVKRILTDDSGKVILVVPVENQIWGNKPFSAWNSAANFTQVLDGDAYYFDNYYGEDRSGPNVWEINNRTRITFPMDGGTTEDEFQAFITVTDYVTFPENENASGAQRIITNTYDEN